MQRLFGVPMDTLAATLLVILALASGAIVAMAVRNRILVSMGVRNVRRRRARSALIVLGLMLATTIISSALVTADTIGHAVRSVVFTALGNTDEVVAAKGAQLGATQAATTGAAAASDVGYFPIAKAELVAGAASRSPDVDGAAPAIIETVAVQDRTSRQNEPRVTLFAAEQSSLGGFGAITSSGHPVSLDDLHPGEVYLNQHAADELDAAAGDSLVVLAGRRMSLVTVRAITSYDGTGTSESAALTSLAPAQTLLGKPGEVNRVLVSNTGDASSGVDRTDSVMKALDSVTAPLGLQATRAKDDGLKAADQAGNTFMNMFTTLGMFSIAAGILLIFLIFVMLAAERRSEMGVARAIGMQRRHLVQGFLFEGAAYDLFAAVIGALFGVGIAFAMVTAIGHAIGGSGLVIERYVQARSLAVAFCLGTLLSLIVVAVSAWRVSRLNIVTAIRNLSEPTVRRRRRVAWARGLLGVAIGVMFVVTGRSSGQLTAFGLGVSVIIVSLVPIVRALGVRERPTYTVAGLALTAWWCLPFGVMKSLVPNANMNFSVWVVGGLMIVLGAVWTIMYNADLLLGGVMAGFGRIRALAPVLKTSIAYPLRNRFRTGVTLAMFTIVVFNLVTGAVTSSSFTNAFNDVAAYSGGFDIRATVAPISPVSDMPAALRTAPGAPAQAITAVSAQSYLPVEMTQDGVAPKLTDGKPPTYLVRGLDNTFLTGTTFGFAAMAGGYHSAADVWAALRSHPGYAVVDSTLAQRHNNWNFGSLAPFQLKGFYLEDASFTPVKLTARDPQTGTQVRLTVIGVLKDSSSMFGVLTSQRALEPFGARAQPTMYFFKVAPGADAKVVAKQLESAFLSSGMQADSLAKLLADGVATSHTMNWLVMGFVGLGLVVGVAALGVIAARSVVERRQQIGVLRAIGYQRRMVQGSMLLESSFISLIAIVVGTGLGLLLASNVVADSASQPGYTNLGFSVPWLQLTAVFAVVYLVALVTTWAPARRASRVYPAEALRYQ